MPKREVPDEDMVDFFTSRLTGHQRVARVSRRSVQLFEIERDTGEELLVFLSDLYTIGISDYLSIRENERGIDCLVTASGYNNYTKEAKEQALSDGVGLFKIGEFLGALNYDEYWKYQPPKKDRKLGPIRRWGA